MRALRLAWLAGTLGAGAVACVERATAPASCPDFCPNGAIDVRDTILRSNITRDSAFRGYVLAHQALTMIATTVANGRDSLDSRPIFTTGALPPRVPLNAGDTTSSVIVASDSLKLTLIIAKRDTAAHNLALRFYRLPRTLDSTTTFADLAPSFNAAPLRTVNIDAVLAKPGGTDSTTGDHIAVDTTTHRLTLTVKFDSVQAPYVGADSGRLGVGIRVGATVPTSVTFSTRNDPALEGARVAWYVQLDSIKGNDTTRIHKAQPYTVGTRFDSYVFSPPLAPLDSTLAVGGAPSARSILRISLPRAIRDSSQIIRATLLLVPAAPPRGAPSDDFVVEAHTALADFGAKSPLAIDATRIDTTRIRVAATDTVRLEVTNLVQFWASDTTKPTMMILRSQEEGGHPGEIRFYPSAAAAYRPALRITYARRFPFGQR